MDFGMLSTASIVPEDNNRSTSTEMEARKQTDKDGRISRASVLLALFVIILSTILPISAIVYVHQLKTGCMGEFSQLRAEFGSTTEKQRYGNTDIVNPSIEEIRMAMFNRAEEFDKELNKLKRLFSNQTEAIAFDIEQLKKIHGKNLTSPQSEDGGFNKNETFKLEIKTLDEKYSRHYENLTNEIASLKEERTKGAEEFDKELNKLKRLFSNRTEAIAFDIEQLKKIHGKNLTSPQSENGGFNKNETFKLEIKTLDEKYSRQYENLTNRIASLKEERTKEIAPLESRIEAMNDSHVLGFDSIAKQIAELQNTDVNQSESLNREIAEREQSDALQTDALAAIQKSLNDTYLAVKVISPMQDEITRLNASQHNLNLELVRLRSEIDKIDQLKTNQSAALSIVANLRNDVVQQQAQAENLTRTLQSVQATIAYYTEIARLYTSTSDWKSYGLMLYKKFGKATYGSASTTCANQGGRLAAKILRDPDAVRSMISSGFLNADPVWVGYDDIQSEGTWRGSDGGSINLTVTPWLSGQPDNFGGNEDCVASFVSGNQLVLNDGSCVSSNLFLCEAV